MIDIHSLSTSPDARHKRTAGKPSSGKVRADTTISPPQGGETQFSAPPKDGREGRPRRSQTTAAGRCASRSPPSTPTPNAAWPTSGCSAAYCSTNGSSGSWPRSPAGAFLKSGLGIEPADVAGILNVLDNHIGADGIHSREDLDRIKGIVALTADRLLALNADDPLVLAVGPRRPAGTLALVGRSPGSAVWLAHRSAGHVAASYEMTAEGARGWIGVGGRADARRRNPAGRILRGLHGQERHDAGAAACDAPPVAKGFQALRKRTGFDRAGTLSPHGRLGGSVNLTRSSNTSASAAWAYTRRSRITSDSIREPNNSMPPRFVQHSICQSPVGA